MNPLRDFTLKIVKYSDASLEISLDHTILPFHFSSHFSAEELRGTIEQEIHSLYVRVIEQSQTSKAVPHCQCSESIVYKPEYDPSKDAWFVLECNDVPKYDRSELYMVNEGNYDCCEKYKK